jgi:hypothetical protein
MSWSQLIELFFQLSFNMNCNRLSSRAVFFSIFRFSFPHFSLPKKTILKAQFYFLLAILEKAFELENLIHFSTHHHPLKWK